MHETDQAVTSRCDLCFLRQHTERETVDDNRHILGSAEQTPPRLRALININMWKPVAQIDDLDCPAARPQRRDDGACIAVAAGRRREIARYCERDLALKC